MINKTLVCAAVFGGTLLFTAANVSAEVPIVQSQADHVATAATAVPLNRQQANAAPDSELMESILFQLDQLQTTVSEQRGIIEELSYQVQVLQQEQKQRYIDLDKRIQALQDRTVVTAVAQPNASNGLSVTEQDALSDEEILAQYNAATALMQERKFDESISQLAIFAKNNPDHPLTANAWYWIGEIYLVQRNPDEAKSAFERIVADYPEHGKVPDSLYKLGVIAQQASDVATAKAYFERVLQEYPNTQSAKLSKARLNSN